MKIQVLSDYDTVESVDACQLKRMIAEKKIMAFRRSDGWVKLGADRVRGDGGEEYDGPERRNVVQKSLSEKQKRRGLHCILGIRGPAADW